MAQECTFTCTMHPRNENRTHQRAPTCGVCAHDNRQTSRLKAQRAAVITSSGSLDSLSPSPSPSLPPSLSPF